MRDSAHELAAHRHEPAMNPARSGDLRGAVVVFALTLIITVLAQLIGTVTIPLGFAALSLLPMIWSLIGGSVVSSQRIRPLSPQTRKMADATMGIAVVMLIGLLSFTMGPNLGLLFRSGPALLLQEVGHLFGTIVLALPLGVLLRMGPATVGATFSIDREGSFAMVSDRYGADSPQYRGVLSMYVFGTMFGAIIIGLVASIATSLHIFDPLALAMGAGVGSGSMMAAATGAVAAAHPELEQQVLAVAAASNVVTGILGVYVGAFVALPLAGKIYALLTKNRQHPDDLPNRTDADADAGQPAANAQTQTQAHAPAQSWKSLAISVALIALAGIPVSSIAAKAFSWQIVLGYAILAVLIFVGTAVSRLTRGKLSAFLVVVTLGVLISSPISPIAAFVVQATSSITFLSLCTVVLGIAGLTIGKSLPLLRSLGWKIIPVGTVAIVSSYVISVVIAEFALGLWS